MNDILQEARDLGDGLVLRRARLEDAEQLVAFNGVVHGHSDDEPATEVAAWTRDLMSGEHPAVRAEDFTVVIDTQADDKIVSSLVLLPQVWSYDGIEFGVGQPELVGTDPAYRRRGLVRVQMDAIHAMSAARGHLVQGITGIPWYYRQFGYEMAVNLSGARAFFWQRRANLTTKPTGEYTLRVADARDIPFLAQLYPAAVGNGFLRLVRDETTWHYRLTGPSDESDQKRTFVVAEDADLRPWGYFAYSMRGKHYQIDEIAAAPGRSLRELALFAMHTLREQSEGLPEDDPQRGDWIAYRLGDAHPVYTALGRQLERQESPYAWYLRVADVPGFLRHITPVLERNLARSVVAGHTGALKLNLIDRHLRLNFERGQLVEIDEYVPDHFFDGDVFLPDLTFLHVLFRYRTIAELQHVRQDCRANQEQSEILLNALFPKESTFIAAFP
jgi:hypothetical protein